MAQGLDTVYCEDTRAELEDFKNDNPTLWEDVVQMVNEHVAKSSMTECFNDEQLENLAYLRLATVMEERAKGG
ncbi:MAG: hypothetical protein H8D23_11145 [Candidatus Brocadiales bacterium]|nr:hypothetical protein [Candidatus Brocadiales bacterium]